MNTLAEAPGAAKHTAESVAEAVLRFVAELRPDDAPAPQELLRRRAVREGSPLAIESSVWRAKGWRWIRFTRISGDGATDIVNFGMFPEPASPFPVLQLESLVLRGRLFLAIHDVNDLADGGSGLEPSPRRALSNNPLFPRCEDRAPWTDAVFSKEVFWTRPQDPGALAALPARTEDFLEAARTWRRGGRRQEFDPERRRARIGALAAAMIENEPSRNYLAAQFGPEWSERFIRGFLFPDFLHTA
ncbi:MAG: hypothetical protein SF028_15035 [Candidatus Sumerlaeia bacterium]|nr:hypothetical protein [Candidatus Sumerlaeia bacterium]